MHEFSPVPFQSTMDNKVVTAEVEGKSTKEQAHKLIFATGSTTPILPPIEGVEIVKGNREFKQLLKMYNSVKLYRKTLEEVGFTKLSDKSQHLDRIAVVGGGCIGVELVEASERWTRSCPC